jgi:GlcNAc-P-P-Und epimerase
MHMKVLVTGGSGFIGTNLIERLLADGHSALNIDIKPPQDERQRPQWREVDIMDASKLSRVTAEFAPTHVVHLAARTDIDEKKDVAGYAVNFDGTRNVIEAATACGTVKRTLLASTRMVCRIAYQPKDEFDYLPTTIYGESKILMEKLTREIDPPFAWCLMRFTSVWGPWFSVPYADFFLAIARGHYIHPRGMRIYKSFGYVGNSVHYIYGLLQGEEAAMHRKTFYVGDTPPLEVFEWANMIARELGRRPTREMPLFVLKTLANIGEVLRMLGMKRVPLTRFRLANLLTQMTYDVEPVLKIAGPLPYTLEEGVKTTIAWAKKHRRF